MKGVQSLFICAVILVSVNRNNAGFSFGEPCNIRNTLYITEQEPKLPHHVTCVDITKSNGADVKPYKYLIKNATTLYAHQMSLLRIPYNFTRAMKHLELIDISGNLIRQFHPKIFDRHFALETLLLNKNNVYIPRHRPLIYSTSLKNFHLSNNNIKRLTPDTFTRVSALITLFLDENYLRSIDLGVFEPLVNLKYLHLGNNKLKHLPERNVLPQSLDIFITKGNPFNCTVTRRYPFVCK